MGSSGVGCRVASAQSFTWPWEYVSGRQLLRRGPVRRKPPCHQEQELMAVETNKRRETNVLGYTRGSSSMKTRYNGVRGQSEGLVGRWMWSFQGVHEAVPEKSRKIVRVTEFSCSPPRNQEQFSPDRNRGCSAKKNQATRLPEAVFKRDSLIEAVATRQRQKADNRRSMMPTLSLASHHTRQASVPRWPCSPCAACGRRESLLRWLRSTGARSRQAPVHNPHDTLFVLVTRGSSPQKG